MAHEGRIKLEGQRRAIREHIAKYKIYPDAWDKNYALKTIRNCQKEVVSLLRKFPNLHASWEDTWVPGAMER
jgi:hypothetical protein